MKTFHKLTLVIFLFAFANSIFAQQNERDQGIKLFEQSNFKGALGLLKKAVKTDERDAKGWYYLGLTYLKVDEEKNAVKALQKATELKPEDALIKNSLAYAYLVKNDLNGASREAQSAVKLDPKMAESYYVMGVVSFRNAAYNSAYEQAVKAIEINPKIAPAYLLKSDCLVASFTKQFGTIIRTQSNRHEILKEAEADLTKFLSLMPNVKDSDFYREYLDSIKFFADYYTRKDVEPPKIAAAAEPSANVADGLKILAKPRANYTDKARRAGVEGTVTLLVGFDADATVKHVLLLNPLGYGLNEEAVKAARGIRFTPATENGKSVSVVKQVQYSFTIY